MVVEQPSKLPSGRCHAQLLRSFCFHHMRQRRAVLPENSHLLETLSQACCKQATILKTPLSRTNHDETIEAGISSTLLAFAGYVCRERPTMVAPDAQHRSEVLSAGFLLVLNGVRSWHTNSNKNRLQSKNPSSYPVACTECTRTRCPEEPSCDAVHQHPCRQVSWHLKLHRSSAQLRYLGSAVLYEKEVIRRPLEIEIRGTL